jgi:hypothetical protein
MLPDGLVMIHRRLLKVYNGHQTSAMANKHDVADCIVAIHCDLHHHVEQAAVCFPAPAAQSPNRSS